MENDGLTDLPQSVRMQWLALAAGLAASWLWVYFALMIGETLVGDSIGTLSALFMLLLFGPLVPIALAAGRVARVPVLRGGHRKARSIGLGLALGGAGLGLTVWLSWLNGGLLAGGVSRGDMSLLLLGFTLTLFQSGVEEVTFRGWLQQALIARLGTPAGTILGAALFAAFHTVGGAREPISLLSITLAGVFFGLLAVRSGGLLAPWAAHFCWNVCEDTVLGLTPNPGNGELGSLFDLDLSGPALWGGGAEGLNDSIGTVAVLLALILPLLLARGSRDAASGAARDALAAPI